MRSVEDNRLSWLVGTAWYHRYTPVNLSIDNTVLGGCGYVPTTGQITPCPTAPQLPGLAIRGLRETVQRHAGLFGQILYDISDNWELEIGARNSWDNNISVNEIHVGILPFMVPGVPFPLPGPPTDCLSENATRALPADNTYFCPPAGPERSKFKDEEPTYKVGLHWTPGDEHFLYLFYARGYKSGAVDGGVRFENETVDDYEFGYKVTLLDGRMQIQTGIFYMDYQQMQQSAFVVHTRSDDDIFSDPAQIINIGDSTIEGFEFEMNSRFGNLGLNFGFGYTSSDLAGITTIDTRFLDPAINVPGLGWLPGCESGEAPIPDFFGPGAPSCFDYFNSLAAVELARSDNVFSPELSYNFSLDYAFETNAGAVIRPRISYSYTDAAFSSLFQSDNYFSIEERESVNLSIGYERDEWSMRFVCNNCTDEVTITSAGKNILYSPPRTTGVLFRYDF
jgi:outer membrane receptor protein involved in Fe transport